MLNAAGDTDAAARFFRVEKMWEILKGLARDYKPDNFDTHNTVMTN